MTPSIGKTKTSTWTDKEMADISRTTQGVQTQLPLWTDSLHSRAELHLLRKFWHMSTGLLIVYLYLAGVSKGTGIQLLGAFLATCITMEALRLKNPVLNEKCIRFFSTIMRSNEINKVSGMPYYAASAIVALLVFPKPVAVLSMLYLALGDPIASLVGVLYSKNSVKIFKGKSLHGTVAGFLVCTAVTWYFLQTQGYNGLDLVRLSLLGGFAGAFAEVLPLKVDDNFSIPVISGFILWVGFIATQFIQ